MPQSDGFLSWDQEKRSAYSRRWYVSAEAKALRRAARYYAFVVSPDGGWRADDVVPGAIRQRIAPTV